MTAMLLDVRPDSRVPVDEEIAARGVIRVAARDRRRARTEHPRSGPVHRVIPNTVTRAYQDLGRDSPRGGRGGSAAADVLVPLQAEWVGVNGRAGGAA